MSANSNSLETSRRILEIAVAQGTLTQAALDTLSAVDGDPCDHAVEQELLSTADVDLLRPLAEPMAFLPGYEILELIGQGAAGAVYRGKQIALGRDVALKVMKSAVLGDSTITGRSQLEARIGASLQHPGIVAVFDYGVHRQRIYLAMEFLSGETLEEYIESNGAIDALESIKIVRQIGAALRYADSQGVVHRDIKPANLILTEDSAGISDLTDNKAIKITDFGLAFNSLAADETRLTVAGSTLGTPGYVAPEQLESTDVDQRADIYALGATLFHMVTGQPPFAGGNVFKAIAAKMQGSDSWLDGMDATIPPTVRQLIIDMTRTEISERIQDYETLDDRIVSILNHPTDTIAAALVDHQAGQQQRPRSRDWPIRRTAVVVGVIAIFAVIATWWIAGNRSSPLQPVRQNVTKTSERPLFFGDGIPEGRSQPGAFWRNSLNAESAPVVEGSGGWWRFAIRVGEQTPEFFRFRIGVDLPEDAEVDVCFGFSPEGNCQIVRISGEQATFGKGRIDDAHEATGFASSSTPAADEWAATEFDSLALSSELSTVRIERQPNGWFVNVNEHQLASAFSQPGDGAAVYVRVKSGKAFFDNIAVAAIEVVADDEPAEF